MLEIDHLWHNSSLIKRMGRRLDCRSNDMASLLKVYLAFLREVSKDASGSMQTFDKAIWEGKQSWSRLYWAGIAGLDMEPAHVKKLDAEGAQFSGRSPSGWSPA